MKRVFSAETAAPLTFEIDSAWMNLLIRNLREEGDVWEGFQFRVGSESRTVVVFDEYVSNAWKSEVILYGDR